MPREATPQEWHQFVVDIEEANDPIGRLMLERVRAGKCVFCLVGSDEELVVPSWAKQPEPLMSESPIPLVPPGTRNSNN